VCFPSTLSFFPCFHIIILNNFQLPPDSSSFHEQWEGSIHSPVSYRGEREAAGRSTMSSFTGRNGDDSLVFPPLLSLPSVLRTSARQPNTRLIFKASSANFRICSSDLTNWVGIVATNCCFGPVSMLASFLREANCNGAGIDPMSNGMGTSSSVTRYRQQPDNERMTCSWLPSYTRALMMFSEERYMDRVWMGKSTAPSKKPI